MDHKIRLGKDGMYHFAECSCGKYKSKRKLTIDNARNSGRAHVTGSMRGRHGNDVLRVFHKAYGVVVYRGGFTVDLQLEDEIRIVRDDRWPELSIEQMSMALDDMILVDA